MMFTSKELGRAYIDLVTNSALPRRRRRNPGGWVALLIVALTLAVFGPVLAR